MAVTVKNATIWIRKGPDRAGLTAEVLEPLAGAGANLNCVMSYCVPGQADSAAVEVFPIRGRKAEVAARGAGFEPSSTRCLQVEGDDRPGLGAVLSRAVAEAGVSMNFLVAQTIGRKFSAMIGFGTDAEAVAAANAIKAAARRRARR
jgi:predicted amino acid-binding ACT domain protein